MACVRQGPLSGYVVPFCPTNHHLEIKESIVEYTLKLGQSYLQTMGLWIHLTTLDDIFQAKCASATSQHPETMDG